MPDYYPMANINDLKVGDYVFHRLKVGNYIVKSIDIEKNKVEVIENDINGRDMIFWVDAVVLTTKDPEGNDVVYDEDE